jgi:hypothetical protein
MDIKLFQGEHPALLPSAVGMIRGLRDRDSSEAKSAESNGQKPVVFCPITTVSIAIRLRVFATATNSALPSGAEALIIVHADNGDAVCQMLVDDLNLKNGGSNHDER